MQKTWQHYKRNTYSYVEIKLEHYLGLGIDFKSAFRKCDRFIVPAVEVQRRNVFPKCVKNLSNGIQ